MWFELHIVTINNESRRETASPFCYILHNLTDYKLMFREFVNIRDGGNESGSVGLEREHMSVHL